ncbi:uracil-DNA glycosylase [Candidatus Woesearchaeota archaeon]|nr:uracil-DNA glycosylase [Candidatus Woesearchaeota archaeon]MBN88463.1 uracil-DNA glycosylase [Candidatus Woesearchaeota archaeon]|tara:strand:- start:167 stop:715 length:549 start_codon:yes stop_codon:yes gene_type:complete
MNKFSCFKCPELANCRTNIVFGKEYSNSIKIMIIGEAPGKNEDISGEPFIGKSGKLLRNELNLNGIIDYYITNIVKCRPPNNRDPTDIEINNCMAHLIDEINDKNPNLILLLGRKSAGAIYQYFGIEFTNISEERGKIKKFEHNGSTINILSTYHPASTIFNKEYRLKFKEDIAKLANITGI